MSKTIAIIIDQNEELDYEVEVHAASVTGDHDTLCGIDANDEEVGHHGIADTLKLHAHRAKIDCPQCRAIFFGIKNLGLTARDFAKE